MISPSTVGIMAGAVALVLALGGQWWLAVVAAVVTWGLRVVLAGWVARRVRSLPRRIDPFAIREPWRFFVRDALNARKRLASAIDGLEPGPRQEQLVDISTRVNRAVVSTWEVAQRGQQLADNRRAVEDDAMREIENNTREQLAHLDIRLAESVGRAVDLSTRAGDLAELDQLGHAVDGIVSDLEALRFRLDTDDGRNV
jgi:hypothetical protein